MRIVLINPPSARLDYTNKVTPLGLCCIAGVLLQSGHEVAICDLNVGDTFNSIGWDKIDYVGITATTPLIDRAYEIIKSAQLYYNNPQIVIGGAHITALPESPYHICRGEGDYYIDNLISGRERSVSNLDDLPIPAYHLLDAKKYVSAIARRNPCAAVETSRGCYGKCIYCSRSFFGHKLRFKSVDRVIEELLFLKSLGYREIHIMDDNFTADIKRAKRICRAIIGSKLNMPWIPRNGIRADRMDKELFTLMKKAGCYKVFFGVESGSQRILDRIKKGITLGQVRTAVALAKKVRLKTGAYYMLGLPGETVKDLDKTMDFALELNTDSINVGIAIPLPGTEFFDKAKQAGRLKTFDWSEYTFRGDVYKHENLTRGTIDRYIKKFKRSYYFRWGYILKRLFSRDGLKTIKLFFKVFK